MDSLVSKNVSIQERCARRKVVLRTKGLFIRKIEVHDEISKR